MDLVLQGEVEGKVFNAFVVVNLHSGGVLVSLKVLDDIREPHREPVEPGHSNSFCSKVCYMWLTTDVSSPATVFYQLTL